MAPWAQSSVVAAVFIAGHYLLLRAASGRLGDTLGALVLEGTAAVGLLLAYALGPKSDVATTRAGIGFAVASGLCISGGSILLFAALRKGGPVAATGVLVMGGGVTLSAIAAPLVFGEGFTPRRALGVALGLAAMVVLSTEGSAP
jgi:drug/metabolite transporter (DMT)-like permease